MENFRVQILTIKPEICSLISKVLDKERFTVTCTVGDEINEKFINDFSGNFDCLILDKDIDAGLTKTIKTKFTNVPIICLPSLGSETNESKDVKYMSEPFKLSELKKAIEEIAAGVI